MNQKLKILLYGSQYRRMIDKALGEVEESYVLSSIDIHILFYLHNAGENNQFRDIARLNLFTRGHISQSLNRLQERKLITMVQDEHDRRCMHIFLTENTGEIMERIQEAYDRINETVFRGVTPEEKAVFLRVAQKINNNIKNEISE